MSDCTLKDVALAVERLLANVGVESLVTGIAEGEADQRRADAEARQDDQRRAAHILKVAKSKQLRKVYSEKGQLLSCPHEGWVLDVALVDVDDDVVSEVDGEPKAEPKTERLKRAERTIKAKTEELSGHLSEELEKRLPKGLGKQLARDLATSIGERWIYCWSPAELAHDRRPAGSGLVPIPGTVTHGERCLLLAAVHRRFAIGATRKLDPDDLSFLCDNGQGRGFGDYAILVHSMVDDLTDDDAADLMAMIEKVRNELAERSGGQQAGGTTTSDSDRTATAKPERKRGRVPDTDPKADADIAARWKTGQYKDFRDLAESMGKSREDIKHAIDRHRHRH